MKILILLCLFLTACQQQDTSQQQDTPAKIVTFSESSRFTITFPSGERMSCYKKVCVQEPTP